MYPHLLGRSIASYVEHYHLERPHQGIGNRPIEALQNLPRVSFCGARDLAVYSAIITEMQLETLSRVLEQDGVLYEIEPADPLTYVVATIVLASVAGIATYVPARRATKIDPKVAFIDE